MEVADSHMTEHFSTLAPSHVDIDMSGEYYDEEYMMHDATEATNDEEIYDAEIDEQPGHDEVEMDEYTDEVADDNETHMGTYVSGDDATVTDVTVEDVQLRSSPVPSATPRVVPLRPISPHAAVDADLPINEAPANTLAAHSPHSVATLVDDSDTHHLTQNEGAKEDPLNEVIDLTDIDDHPDALSGDVAEPAEPEHEVPHNELDPTEQELYESDNLAVVTGSPTVPTVAPDQSLEEEEEDATEPTARDANDATDVPSHLEIPEQADQDSHSPIDEALVINQQVRDDAADSMEPSPPVRLYYKDENKGIDKTFDIFASSDSASQDVELLFHDNRTLFYEPLSSFFLRLRETEYFSSGDWQESEMQLTMDLDTSDLSISEDHKDTDNISLFKLSFVWSGLGLEGPLCLRLQRYPERFSVRFARLVEQVEQRDLQNEEGEELHEVQHEEYEPEVHEAESAGVDGNNTIQHEVEVNEDNSGEGDEDGTHGESRMTEENDRPHDAHEDEEEDADPPETEPPKALDGQHQETSTRDDMQKPQDSESNTSPGYVAHERSATSAQGNEESVSSPDAQGENEDAVYNTDLRDNDDDPASHKPSPNSPQNAPEGQVFQDDEYKEYEEIGGNDLAPQVVDPNGVPASPWEHAGENEYDDYEESYEDADGEQTTENQPLTDDATNDPAASDDGKLTPSTAQAEIHGSAPNLKRNIDDLEYETYETPSAPSSPASDYKRVKHT